MINWNCPNPVFFDLETQSACDLKAAGGRQYAADPSTRVLTAVFLVDGTFHVWIPTTTRAETAVRRIDPARLWPDQLGPPQPLTVYGTPTPPNPVKAAIRAGRTFVAHNCFGFDRYVWEHCVVNRGHPWHGNACPPWADTLPLARTGGYPGRLNAIAQDLMSQGKDAGHRILMKFIQARVERSDAGSRTVYPQPGAGDLEVICRYNVADVELLRRVWERLSDVPVEADVIDAHDAVNERGVGLDDALAVKLVQVSGESVARAADAIASLTGGALSAKNLRSTPQVNAWLAAQGVRIRDYTGKTTLRKDFVTQALANPWLMLDDESPVSAAQAIAPEVFEVLRLRSAALRITGAKGGRAVVRQSPDGRARDLHTYWQAHTGRWSSAGIQVHNLPRPKKGVPVTDLLAAHESGEWGRDGAAAYEMIAAKLPAPKPGGARLTVDDALSALLRPLFVPGPDWCFAVCDYAAVECRGIAWIAGEESLLDALASGRDVYREFGARLFGKPAEEITDAERQIAKVTVLGCGYALGSDKFRIYCGLQGVDLAAAGTSAEACVDAYRGAYPAIAGAPAGVIDGRPYRRGGVWDRLAKAAMSAVAEGGVHDAGRTRWAYDGSALVCELPSGRCLRYRNCRIEDRVPGYALALGLDKTKPTLVYDSTYGPTTLYGGKIAENVVQAICRDLLASALVGAERVGLQTVLHVHDELVAEVPLTGRGESLDRLATVMTTPPDWAAGFPVAVEGFTSPRYLKSPPKGWEHVKKSSA